MNSLQLNLLKITWFTNPINFIGRRRPSSEDWEQSVSLKAEDEAARAPEPIERDERYPTRVNNLIWTSWRAYMRRKANSRTIRRWIIPCYWQRQSFYVSINLLSRRFTNQCAAKLHCQRGLNPDKYKKIIPNIK